MNTAEQQARHDAWIGKDMEGWRVIDRAQYPEAYPRRQYPPLAVTQRPEYQLLAGKAIDAQINIDKWHDTLRMLLDARDALKRHTEPDSLPKLDSQQHDVLSGAAKAMGAFISRAVGEKRRFQEAQDAIRKEMIALETKGDNYANV